MQDPRTLLHLIVTHTATWCYSDQPPYAATTHSYDFFHTPPAERCRACETAFRRWFQIPDTWKGASYDAQRHIRLLEPEPVDPDQ